MNNNFIKRIRNYWTNFIRKLFCRLMPLHKKILIKFMGNRPISIFYWNLINSLIHIVSFKKFCLESFINTEVIKGTEFIGAELSKIFEKDEFGKWSMEIESIEILCNYLETSKPAYILEFGSGLSTIILALYASKYNSLVVSIEQNDWVKFNIINRLKLIGIEEYVIFEKIYKNNNGSFSISQKCYVMLKEKMQIEFALIDGPFGPPGCREIAFSILRKILKTNLEWLMDDALRKEEMKILNKWKHEDCVKVIGIFSTKKGLAYGKMEKPG